MATGNFVTSMLRIAFDFLSANYSQIFIKIQLRVLRSIMDSVSIFDPIHL